MRFIQEIDGRLYFRRTWRGTDGRKRTVRHRLPDRDDPRFLAEYQRHYVEATGAVALEGSMAELVARYRMTQGYRQLAPSTRRDRDGMLDEIVEKHGTKPYAELTKGKLKQLRDELGDTPGKANKFISVMSVLFKAGIDLEMVAHNPAADIPRLPIGEYEPWSEKQISAVMERASPMMRLAVTLMLYTGQRVGDVCRMRWADIEDGVIHVVQQKTGKEVWVPLHSAVKDELKRIPRHITHLLCNRFGRPMRPLVLWREFDRLREDLRLGDICLHGLRKNAVNALLEAGCTAAEVASITGQTLQVIEQYAKRRNGKLLSVVAMRKWEAR